MPDRDHRLSTEGADMCKSSHVHPSAITRRRLGYLLASFAAGTIAGRPLIRLLETGAIASEGHDAVEASEGARWFDEALARLIPPEGFQSRIALGDAVVRLVEHGIIDREKFLARYRPGATGPESDTNGYSSIPPISDAPQSLTLHNHDGAGASTLGPSERLLLNWPSSAPLRLTRTNADVLLNLLWPLGLANFLEANAQSPVNGDMLPQFASTAGWTLGREPSGAGYFNSVRIVELTPAQEELAVSVSSNAYRPCCNNSTFFQDCNHGSALFGLMQLGAAQGVTETELYREALAFNAHWFPDAYVEIALYFTVANGRDWSELDPATMLSFDYSAIGPWQQRVHKRLANYPGLLPIRPSRSTCTV